MMLPPMRILRQFLLCSSFCFLAAFADLSSNLDNTSSTTTASMQSRLAQYTAARSSLHESIIDTIGKTPIIKLQKMAPKGVNVYVKLECENPGGSLKDRLGYGVIEWAEKHGHLKPGQVSE
jgi:threonine synthase